MYPHRIRLRGPWECQPLARRDDTGQPLPPTCRLTVPCQWSAALPGFAGRVRLSRRFGYPGRIDAHERVWLTCAGLSDRARVWLNGQELGECAGAFEFEVTALLQPRNELVLEVDGSAEQGDVWGEVALEVRCTAFVRGLRVWAMPPGELHVVGEVVGWAEGLLELYVILGRSTAAYGAVTAGAEGVPFHLAASDLPPERWRANEGEAEQGPVVRIELVKGASIWYSWEQPCPLPATHTEES